MKPKMPKRIKEWADKQAEPSLARACWLAGTDWFYRILKSRQEDMTKECKHDWQEDPMCASGAITFISGTPKDLGIETKMVCSKCGEVRFVRTKDLGSIVDIYERGNEQ